jgi:hypothetical protein
MMNLLFKSGCYGFAERNAADARGHDFQATENPNTHHGGALDSTGIVRA